MGFQRTFRIDRLFNQFLKPKRIPIEKLPELTTKLYEAGFIDLTQDIDGLERYSENEKLTNRQNRDELFKIIQGLK